MTRALEGDPASKVYANPSHLEPGWNALMEPIWQVKLNR